VRTVLAALLALVAAAGCATRPPHPDSFSFAVIGDAPYNAREELEFDAMLARIGGEQLAFVVHVGDIKAGGGSACTDALYLDRRSRLDASRHALVLTPGDNDWTDCRRDSNGGMDPLERLARMRELFFADGWSLGRSRMPLARQEACAERDTALPGLPRTGSGPGAARFRDDHVVNATTIAASTRPTTPERCPLGANRAWVERASPRKAGRALVIVRRRTRGRRAAKRSTTRSSRRWRWAPVGSASPSSSCTATRTRCATTARSATAGASPWRTRSAWRPSEAPWWVRVTVDPGDAALPHRAESGGRRAASPDGRFPGAVRGGSHHRRAASNARPLSDLTAFSAKSAGPSGSRRAQSVAQDARFLSMTKVERVRLES
jgi:hypothetical protein